MSFTNRATVIPNKHNILHHIIKNNTALMENNKRTNNCCIDNCPF